MFKPHLLLFSQGLTLSCCSPASRYPAAGSLLCLPSVGFIKNIKNIIKSNDEQNSNQPL